MKQPLALKEKIKKVLDADKSEKFTARQIKDALDDSGALKPEDTLPEIRSTMNKFYKDRFIPI